MRKITVIGLTLGLIATTNSVFAQAIQQQPSKIDNMQPMPPTEKPGTITASITESTASNKNAQERLTKEDDFKAKLTPQMQVVFNNMSPEGKAMAMMMATQNGEDYNMAVKRAVQKMANKRMAMPGNQPQ